MTIRCPAMFVGSTGDLLVKTHLENLSDGGAFASLPPGSFPACGSEYTMEFSVPRTTANTHMFERFTSIVRVVRHHDEGAPTTGIALQFGETIELGLDA